MSKTDKTNEDRREKYEMLKRAGFTSREATIYKDRSWEFIEVLISDKAVVIEKHIEVLKEIQKMKL